MARDRQILTTGQVAEICKVAPRTVTKWFDSGQLKGYRIPGSRDRRIPLGELIRFMKEHNMPTDHLDVGGDRALIIWDGGDSCMALASRLKDVCEVEVATDSFGAGVMMARFLPSRVFVSLLCPAIDACAVCRSIKRSQEFGNVQVIAVADRFTQSEEAALREKGFDVCLSLEGSVRTREQSQNCSEKAAGISASK
jgi:excisionase family DNA binding protein